MYGFFFLHIFQACLWISIPVLGRNDSLPQCANLNYQIHHMRKNIAAESLWGLVFSGVCSLFWFNMWRTPPSPTVDSVSHVAGARLKEPLLQRVKYSVCLSDTHFLSPPPPPPPPPLSPCKCETCLKSWIICFVLNGSMLALREWELLALFSCPPLPKCWPLNLCWQTQRERTGALIWINYKNGLQYLLFY